MSYPEGKRSTSNEDIYLTQVAHDTLGKGLICWTDDVQAHGCTNNEYVVVVGPHWHEDEHYNIGKNEFLRYRCNKSKWDEVNVKDIGYCHYSYDPARRGHFEDNPDPDGWKLIAFVDGERLIGVRGKDVNPDAGTIYYSSVCKLEAEEKCGTRCDTQNKKLVNCENADWECINGNWYEQLTENERHCKEQLGVTDKNDIQACANCVGSLGAWDQAGKTCNCKVEWRKFNAKDLRCENDNSYCGGILCTSVGEVFACVGDKAIPIKGYDSPQDRLLRCNNTGIPLLWWKSQKVEELSINVCVVNDADGKTPAVNDNSTHTWKKIMDGLFVNTYYAKPDSKTGVYQVVQDNDWWCKTCPDGQFYNGSECLYSHQEKEAWCLLRKKQDEEKDNKYEIDWTDDGCKCGKAGYEWDDNAHECVDNRETFCGLKCGEPDEDKANQIVKPNTTVICNAGSKIEIKKCNTNYAWEEVTDAVKKLKVCDVTAPDLNEVVPKEGENWTAFAGVVFMNGAEKVVDDVQHAYKFDDDETKKFCRVCEKDKTYYDGTGKCLTDPNEAWCKFKEKRGLSVEWTDDGCNCTEQGKYWNKGSHSCEEKGTFCGLLCGNAYNEKIILCRDENLELRQCIASEGNWKPYTPEGATGDDWKTVLDQQCSGDAWYAFSKSGMLFKYKNKDVHPVDEDWAKNAYVITGDDFLKANWCLPCPKGKFYVESDGVGKCIDNEQQAKCINYTGAQWSEDPEGSGNYRCICDDPKSHWTGKECRANGETCAERCAKETMPKGKNETYSPQEQCVACCNIGGGVDWDMSNHTCDCKDARKAWNAKTNVCDWTNDEIIKRAVDGVSPFFNNVEKNKTVWRTEEGKFNTTRLASDAIAGTVLGTVGGIVSANVIKKNQLAKGYDVLHCAIGGQNVADWGDTFNVLGPKD